MPIHVFHPSRRFIHAVSFIFLLALTGLTLSTGCAWRPLSSEQIWPVRMDGAISRDGTADWIRSAHGNNAVVPSRRAVDTIIPHRGPTVSWQDETATPPRARIAPLSGLKITATVVKQPADKNSMRHNLRITFSNTGKAPVFVARRLQAGIDVLIEITNARTGEPLTYIASREIMTPAMQGGEFIFLAPGASFSRSWRLENVFPELKQPGDYILRCRVVNLDNGPLEIWPAPGRYQRDPTSPYAVWVGVRIFSPIRLSVPKTAKSATP